MIKMFVGQLGTDALIFLEWKEVAPKIPPKLHKHSNHNCTE
jgi:hypothetical protein